MICLLFLIYLAMLNNHRPYSIYYKHWCAKMQHMPHDIGILVDSEVHPHQRSTQRYLRWYSLVQIGIECTLKCGKKTKKKPPIWEWFTIYGDLAGGLLFLKHCIYIYKLYTLVAPVRHYLAPTPPPPHRGGGVDPTSIMYERSQHGTMTMGGGEGGVAGLYRI